MADEFTLTPQPIRAIANAKQALKDALDVSAYDIADVLLLISAVEGTNPTAIIRIITGMQTESEDGWVEAVASTAVTTSGSQKIQAARLFKYIRWEVVSFGGTGTPVVVFTLSGMLRRN